MDNWPKQLSTETPSCSEVRHRIYCARRPTLKGFARPLSVDFRTLAAAAALIELFAERLHQEPPAWAPQVGALSEPIYLLKAAETMERLRELCERQAPERLRKRGFYAPPNFLESA